MEKKNNKSKIIVIIIAVLLIVITAVLVINNKREIQNNIDGTGQEDSTEFVKSKEKVNAYEYIISTMNEPEFWDEEIAMEYWTRYLTDEEIAERKEKIPNGSGWYLSDVSKAEFSRGCQSSLIYDFANFKAYKDDGVLVQELDFKNSIFKIYVKNEPESAESVSTASEWAIDGDVYYIGEIETDSDMFIKNSMMNYAYLFELAGCPILLQPEGTLESYKNLEINPIENYKRSGWSNGNYYELRNQYDHMELDPNNPGLTKDGWIVYPHMKGENKIDYVWEQEGYEYDIRNKDDLQWTDDYTQVLEVANSLPSIIDSNGYDLSQAVMIFVNTQKYESDKQYDNYKGMYPNITSNMFTYMARPILQKIYGKDMTYYSDTKNLRQEPQSLDEFAFINCRTDEDFKNMGLPNGCDNGDAAFMIEKTVQDYLKEYNTRITAFMFDDIDAGDLFEPFDYYKDLCTAAGIEWPYSGLYPFTFLMTTDVGYQKKFGLR